MIISTFNDYIFQMKHDFKKMEDEMTKLKDNMTAITDFSEKISGTLQDKRQQITKLSGVHSLLTKVHVQYTVGTLTNMKAFT